MSGDLLTFEMATATEGDPSIMLAKNWLNILDNQSQNYTGNQIIIDTSQLCNSNKYLNYREAYLMIPLLITLTTETKNPTNVFDPTNSEQSADYAFGLKNWIGSIVHSFSLDLQGTTIVQLTPYCGLWNSFKLMTSLSYNDLLTQYSSIGFYPDSALSVKYNTAPSAQGQGTCNNNNYFTPTVVSGANNTYNNFNYGFLMRQQAFNYDPATNPLLTAKYCNQLYKSYIFNKVASSSTSGGCVQQAVMGCLYLKHLHDFFQNIPLLKGLYLRFTLNINQPSITFNVQQYVPAVIDPTTGAVTTPEIPASLSVVSMTNPLNGVSPLMIASAQPDNGSANLPSGNYILSLCVGATCLNSAQKGLGCVQQAPLAQSVTLNVPAYSFAPTFEQSYLSNPVKKIVYEDIYQYYIPEVRPDQTMNVLATNGISNIHKVLLLPYFYPDADNGNMNPIQSPFEGSGAGPTSPYALIGQFQIQISGQNQLYNTYQYSYNEFLQQLYGINAVNSGMTDGLTSGLLSQIDFETNYCYYVVQADRRLAVENLIPMSVQVLGQNCSSKSIQVYVFISYGVEVSIDAITGARV